MKKIKILVDWINLEVVTKEDYEARKTETISDILNDTNDWNEWLDGKYFLNEIFDMTEQEKEIEHAEYLESVE